MGRLVSSPWSPGDRQGTEIVDMPKGPAIHVQSGFGAASCRPTANMGYSKRPETPRKICKDGWNMLELTESVQISAFQTPK